jgi:hypothetical protein
VSRGVAFQGNPVQCPKYCWQIGSHTCSRRSGRGRNRDARALGRAECRVPHLHGLFSRRADHSRGSPRGSCGYCTLAPAAVQ